MATILSALYGAGKTSLASEICFEADIGDAVIACGIVGGYNPIMNAGNGCANYVPDLGAALTLHYTSLKESVLSNNAVVLNSILDGDFFQFVNGIYMPSSFSPCCVHTAADLQTVFAYFFDENGNPTQFGSCIFVVLVDEATSDVDVLVRSELVFDRVSPKFKGLPYIRVGESAVAAPMEWAHPITRTYANRSVSDRIRINLFEKMLGKNSVVSALSQDGFMLHQGAAGVDPVMESFIANLSDDDLGIELSELRDVLRSVETLEREARMSNIQRERAEFRTTPSHVILNSRGKPYMDNFPAIEMLFGLNRCIVDSITSVVMSTPGTALSGGLSATLVGALGATNHSEAILVYTPVSVEEKGDPFYGKEIGGYVDGYVFADANVATSTRLYSIDTSVDRKFFISSRNSTGGRGAKYLLFDNGVSYGTTHYRDSDGTIKAYAGNAGVSQRFDDKLMLEKTYPNGVVAPITTLAYTPIGDDRVHSTAAGALTASQIFSRASSYGYRNP